MMGAEVVGILFQFLILYYYCSSMLLVETSNHSQEQQLEQQFSLEGGVFQVPARQSSAIASLLRTVTYEHFHSSLPPAALKLQEFALRTVSGVLSLDLYRQALAAVREGQERYQLYQEYILHMNEAFDEDPFPQALLAPAPQQQNLDELFEEAGRGHGRSASVLEMPEVPMLRLDSAREDCGEDLRSEMTKNTNSTGSKSHKETLAGMARLANFFHSPSAVYCREDWRTDRELQSSGQETSREIDSFTKRGSGVLQANDSLQSLLASELAYDIKRQALESVPLSKQLQQRKQREQRYNRKIKDALIFSKIGLRKRK